MRPIFALSAAAMLAIPDSVLAQSAGTTGVDANGTGSVTLGTGADPRTPEDDRTAMFDDLDDARDRTTGRAAGPDIRFH